MFSDRIKTIPQYIAPKYALTLYAGFWANIKIGFIKNRLIQRFIKKYGVNMQEAVTENIRDYSCFNDFFIRHLKPECRPIATAGIISPVDGCVSEIGTIKDGQLLQAKGRYYSVHELLACDKAISSQFHSGCFTTLYLSPKDYHRIHMPVTGTLQKMTYVPGKLFSVQPLTARVVPNLFAKNERLVTLFKTEVGLMAMVLVGAAIVGSIGTQWHGDICRSRHIKITDYSSDTSPAIILERAAKMGYFKLGSTVILLFSNKKLMHWLPEVIAGQSICFGEALGEFTKGEFK